MDNTIYDCIIIGAGPAGLTPRIESLGNLLVARRVVVVLVEVLVAPRDIAVLVYLVIVVELGESRGEKVKR